MDILDAVTYLSFGLFQVFFVPVVLLFALAVMNYFIPSHND
jgi:hypothetical protein